MRAVFKYVIDLPVTELTLPIGFKVLTVQGQNNQVCIWGEVDKDAPTEKVVFEIYGAGHDIPDSGRKYIGTAQVHEGALVWHVYQRADI